MNALVSWFQQRPRGRAYKIEKRAKIRYSARVIAEVAQLVEQLHGKEQVAGSIPAFGSRFIIYNRKFASVAQLVEHLTRNEKVVGSIPTAGSSSIALTVNKWKKNRYRNVLKK